MYPDQLAGAVVVVDADREPVHARLSGARRRTALVDGEPGESTGTVDVEIGAQRVQARGLQPLLAPVRQVAARRLLQRAEQIRERGVVVRVIAEVVAQARQERLQPDVGHQLLEHAGALGVGDAVEVDLDGRQVGDVGGHRVGGRQLVLPVGPGLLHIREGGPGLLVLGGLGLAQHRGEGREGLVEPQVIPPLHGDEVAEPHVGHLVQHGLGAPLVRVARDLGAEDVVLQERHGAGVLHGTRVELGHEQLVVLAERVRRAEVLVVEGESLLGLGEQPLGVHELGQRRAAEDAQRNVPVLVGVDVVPPRVRPGDQRGQVRAHLRGGGEGVLAVSGGRAGAVRDHLPVRGRGDCHIEGRLEVRLVEAGEHPLGVGGFEL
ncbi:Uncharacterised protein [Mycobacteroides abscessus subsp. abscessus]|nr:Uncharacterised protein [Mycobacteroides abscessus subsp. abscessus]